MKSAPIVKVDYKDAAGIEALNAEQVGGKAVITEIPDFRREAPSKQAKFVGRMRLLKAALIVSIDRTTTKESGLGEGRLIDPEGGRKVRFGAAQAPFMLVHDPRVFKFYDSMNVGEVKGSLSLNLAAPARKSVGLRNIVGLLRGADPVLRESYVIVSAHYDHIGIGNPVYGDEIYNGANDDGSGTVSVIELASALAALKQKLKRSIVFIAWFGEERGLLGSRYYGRNPVFPLEKTVAMVNLEQIGRTDSAEGPLLNSASMTGFDFTDLGQVFKAAGEKTGINVYKHEKNSDRFFAQSDNQAFADAGIPAHTLCVAYSYPDYHQPGDHWEKVDFNNMAGINRMIALALVMIADDTEAPKWNEANPKTARYLRAWKALNPEARYKPPVGSQ